MWKRGCIDDWSFNDSFKLISSYRADDKVVTKGCVQWCYEPGVTRKI